MATHASHKRLTREYITLSTNPPPYITAHPSESNILEWHYILTGPPGTPYEGGQYWGTLVFPVEYPFAPPAIRMHTPSGRFQCSERLCLSISDFHPKSFNPTLGVSTILLGVLSFMTSEEITTGSLMASNWERKVLAARTRWWNSTGGGSTERKAAVQQSSNTRGFGAIKAGDGGKRFREQWPELDKENWEWMEKAKINPQTGESLSTQSQPSCSPEASALRRRAAGGSAAGLGAVVDGGREVRNAGRSWVRRNIWYLLVVGLVGYGMLARVLGDQQRQTTN